MNRHQIKLAAQQNTLIQFGLSKLANAAQEVGAFRKFMAGEHAGDFAKRMTALRGAGMGAAAGGLGGAVVGAASNEDDRLGGAIKGGLGGAAVGGLAGGAFGYHRGGQALSHPTAGAGFQEGLGRMREGYLAGTTSARDASRSVSGMANAVHSIPRPPVAKAAALSPGQIGGLVGAGVGGLGGYLSNPEAEAQERLLRTLGGAGLGGVAGYGVGHYGFGSPAAKSTGGGGQGAINQYQREVALSDASRVAPPSPATVGTVDDMSSLASTKKEELQALRDQLLAQQAALQAAAAKAQK